MSGSAEGGELHTARLSGRENIRERALQTLHDLLETTQGNALLAHFQSVEGGRRESDLAGKFGVRQIAALLAQEGSQLFFQGLRHARTLTKNSSHLRDILLLISTGGCFTVCADG